MPAPVIECGCRLTFLARNEREREVQRILIRMAINGVALWIASLLIDGIELAEDFWKIVLVVVIFGLVNALVKPVAKLLSLPFIVLTLGIFILVINAVMLLITDWLTASLEVDGFFDALLGAIVISIVSWALTIFIPDKSLVG